MKKNNKGTVLTNEKIAKDTYKLVFSSNIKEIKAGQFVSILCKNKTLRRPFSVSGFADGRVTVLYKLKGGGTKEIQTLTTGDEIDFLAPLGNGFNFSNIKSALLIGAGIGIAPMLTLKTELNKNNIKNYLITGFKEEDEIIKGSDETVIGGSVLDNIESVIEKVCPDIIFSCGPLIVLKLVSDIGKKFGIKTQVAMEKVMACSIGVCRGCIIELQNGKNASVCKDGPVFDGEAVKWQI